MAQKHYSLPAAWITSDLGWIIEHKFGQDPDLDIVDGDITIWDGGAAYPYQTTAQALEVVSGEAADASGGSRYFTRRPKR